MVATARSTTARTSAARTAATRHALARRRSPFAASSGLRNFYALALLLLCFSSLLSSLALSARGQNDDEPLAETTQNEPSILSDGLLKSDYRIEVRGADGKQSLLTNITLEELRRLERIANSVSQLPAATLTQATAKLRVDGAVADIEAEFEVQVGNSNAPAVVDLRMGSCRLTEAPNEPSGDVQSLFQVNPFSDGYQWLLLGQANQRYRLVIKGKIPIRQKSARNSLSLDLPVAVTKLEVTLPSNAVDERLRSDDVAERVEVPEGVRLDVSSRGGEFSLSWREQGALQRVAAVEAESTTTFEIVDPSQPWSATTTVSVRAYGNDTGNRFRIRLPAGAQWRTYPSPEFDRYRITMVAPDSDDNETTLEENAGSDSSTNEPVRNEPVTRRQVEELVVERLEAASTEAITLPLEWEWLPGNTSGAANSTQVQVPVPTVTNVDVHKGTVNCIYPSSYVPIFREGPGARLVQQGRLPNAFGRQQLQFQFDRQDFELSVELRREQSLPTVRPTYKVHVDRHKLVLTAWFNCSFDTSRQQMRIGLIPGDWIIEENTARVLRDVNDPQSAEAEVLNVSRQEDGSYIFSGREPDGGFGASRRVEQLWRVVAERSWNPDDNNQLEFQTPVLIRGEANGNAEIDHGSGVLLVLSDNNIVNRWRETASTGLLPDSFSTEYQKFAPETRSREPLAYRFQSRGTTPTWAGVAEFLPQQISSEQLAIVEVLPADILVKQDFELRIANEPLQSLKLAVHADVKQLPQIFVNGNLVSLQTVGGLTEPELRDRTGIKQPVAAVSISEPHTAQGEIAGDASQASVTASSSAASPNPASPGWREYAIVGAPSLIGACKVSVITSVPWRSNRSDSESEATRVAVPLVQLLFPTPPRHIREDWTLISDYNVDVTGGSGEAPVDLMDVANRRRSLRDTQLLIPLRLQKQAATASAPVTIHGSWLQSVISASERRDRFVARVKSNSGKLLIRLPGSAQLEKVAIDGVPVDQPLAVYDYKSISITLPSEPTPRDHVVELFYFVDETLGWLSRLTIEAPVIEGATNMDRFYWQLVVPSLYHLASSPGGLTAEWAWQWNGLWWHRRSVEDQASLERWLGSSVQTRQSLSANSYVMSGQGKIDAQEVQIVSRFALWVPIGSLAIILAMLLLNVGRLRHPSIAVLVAGLIASLAMVLPDLAVLFGQTSLLATGLVALIFITQAAIDSRVRRRSVFSARPTTQFEASEQASAARGSRPPLPSPIRGGSSVVAVEER